MSRKQLQAARALANLLLVDSDRFPRCVRCNTHVYVVPVNVARVRGHCYCTRCVRGSDWRLMCGQSGGFYRTPGVGVRIMTGVYDDGKAS